MDSSQAGGVLAEAMHEHELHSNRTHDLLYTAAAL